MRERRNQYKTGGNREALIFPGSGLYEKREKRAAGGGEKSSQPPWIVAGEIVHTSQLFARMVARIDPEWVVELGAHLCEVRHGEPGWDARSGRVLVTRRTLLHGLEVKRERVDYGKVDPEAATQLFIRAALIDDDEARPALAFVAHNTAVRHKAETRLSRMRRARVDAVEDRLFGFYAARLRDISSVHDLNRRIREQGGGSDAFLRVTEAELTAGDEAEDEGDPFPESVAFGTSVLPLSYVHKPGAEDDGVTVRVPAAVAAHLSTGQVQWMVPGMREEIAAIMLRALPKPLRRQLMPIEPKAREIAREFDAGRADFHEALAGFLTGRYRVAVRASDWPPRSVPVHLQPRVEVIDPRGNGVLAAGRDLGALRAVVEKQDWRTEAWERMARRVERFALRHWSFGDLPGKVLVEEVGGVPVFGWPGLAAGDEGVDVRLFRTEEEAMQATPAGVRQLAELALAKEGTWLTRELRALGTPAPAGRQAPRAAGMGEALARAAASAGSAGSAGSPASAASRVAAAREHMLAHLLRLEPLLPLTEARFAALCDSVRRDLPMATRRLLTLWNQIMDQRAGLLAIPKTYPGLAGDLCRLIPESFPAEAPHEQLPHIPRYLKAMKVRHDRWVANPGKDADKADLIERFTGWEARVAPENHEMFRWMLEEYRVQVFAQEIGTAQPVSAKRLETLMTQ